jgi:hypothetical protein
MVENWNSKLLQEPKEGLQKEEQRKRCKRMAWREVLVRCGHWCRIGVARLKSFHHPIITKLFVLVRCVDITLEN